MTQSLLATINRIVTAQNVTVIVSKKFLLQLSKSKWKLTKVGTTAARDHMTRTGRTATMSTVRKKGMLITNSEISIWSCE